jgi:AmiR/NasT family two-component response regulator
LFDGRQLHRCSDADDELSDHARQAVCLIAKRAGCGLREAFDRLRRLADRSRQTLEHAALDVLDGVLPIDL